MRQPGYQTMVAIDMAIQASPSSDRGGNECAASAVATFQEKYIDEIRDCLTEQVRLLAIAPEFGNKALISNCAQVSLMLIKQVRRAAAGRGEAESRIRRNFNASR